MRLIDADALREYLGIETADCTKCKDGFSIYGYCKRGGDFQTACYAIDIAPTVDAVPVRHGYWRHYEGMLYCSECGTEFYDDIMEYCGDNVPHFCPECGARMDGKDGDGK